MSSNRKIILVQLGSPKSPSIKDVREYLRAFLSNRKVVDVNPVIWKVILNLFILPFRSKKSSAKYQRVWDGEQFLLEKYTRSFAKKLQKSLDCNVETFFILKDKNLSTDGMLVSLLPQYCESTTGLIDFPENSLKSFHDRNAFINGSVKQIEKHLNDTDQLILSFHGIPEKMIARDQYYNQCKETFKLIKEKVVGIDKDKIHIGFQSRFGFAKWTMPDTRKLTLSLVEKGHKKIAVYCPSFAFDCLETVDEIGRELREEVACLSGNLQFIPCLNDSDDWVCDFAELVSNNP